MPFLSSFYSLFHSGFVRWEELEKVLAKNMINAQVSTDHEALHLTIYYTINI